MVSISDALHDLKGNLYDLLQSIKRNDKRYVISTDTKRSDEGCFVRREQFFSSNKKTYSS